jgi:UDP:flavonoid glycosyltransferase YjiC (YdhE family)
MATILFIVSEQIGHLHATFRIANRLSSRGHQVVYLGRRASRPVVERQGFRFEAGAFLEPPPPPALEPPSVSPWRAAAVIGATLGRRRQRLREWPAEVSRLLLGAAEVVRGLRPDLLVFDPFLLLYYPLFWRHEVPALVLSANPLLDWDPRVPPYTASVVPSGSRRSLARVGAAWSGSWLSYMRRKAAVHARQALLGPSYPFTASALAAATGFPLARERIDRPVWFDLCLRCVPELVLWTPGFEFPRSRPLRAGVHYVGPSVEMQRVESELAWNEVPRRSRLVYCSLGTVDLPALVPQRIAFLQHVVRAFERLPDCALVMASGTGVSPDRFRPWPANVAIWEQVPQLAVLRRADLMITHGGANSLKESILSGVPLLVYPRRADQPGNAARVVYHRLGSRGNPDKEAPPDIAAQVRQILADPSYRHNVARLRAEFLDYDRRGVDAATVESFLEAPVEERIKPRQGHGLDASR